MDSTVADNSILGIVTGFNGHNLKGTINIGIAVNHAKIGGSTVGHFRSIRKELQLARFHFTKAVRFKASIYLKVLKPW